MTSELWRKFVQRETASQAAEQAPMNQPVAVSAAEAEKMRKKPASGLVRQVLDEALMDRARKRMAREGSRHGEAVRRAREGGYTLE